MFSNNEKITDFFTSICEFIVKYLDTVNIVVEYTLINNNKCANNSFNNTAAYKYLTDTLNYDNDNINIDGFIIKVDSSCTGIAIDTNKLKNKKEIPTNIAKNIILTIAGNDNHINVNYINFYNNITDLLSVRNSQSKNIVNDMSNMLTSGKYKKF